MLSIVTNSSNVEMKTTFHYYENTKPFNVNGKNKQAMQKVVTFTSKIELGQNRNKQQKLRASHT